MAECGTSNLRGGELVARVNSIVQELDTSQMGNTLGILPLDQNVIHQASVVLEDGGEVVGVGQGTGDGLVGPSTSPMVPNSDTSLKLNSEMVVGGQEALLGVVGFSTTGVWQRGPDGGGPVGRAS